MNLYLVRHGYADNSSPDNKRGLTKTGIDSLNRSTALWKSYIEEIDYVLTSPLNRARQTAAIIADKFECRNDVITEKVLEPGATLDKIEPVLSALDSNNIVIVGHNPDIPVMIADLVSNYTCNVIFRPGTLAGIEINKMLRRGVLKFLIPPVE